MLTPLTQTSISLLHDIALGTVSENLSQYSLYMNTISELLLKMESAGLIRCKDPNHRGIPASYELARPCSSISLMDLLEAIGEHLNCNHPTNEVLYEHYRGAAAKLGVLNHMTRFYLSEIKLNDLF